jgi:predicted metalloprotease
MKWKQGRRSDNVEDRRGQKVSPGLAVGGSGLGFLVLALLVAVLGGELT